MKKPKQTRREKFLSEMEAVVPWGRLLSVIEPHYPKAGNGRRPFDLSAMLRIHFMQQWFSYSDPAMEEARTSADRGYDYPRIHAHLEQNLIEDWVARKAKPGKPLDAWTRGLNHAIAQLRAIGEHPFRILKRQFGYTKVRYRGLEKNTAQLVTLFALGNLYQARRALLATG